MRKFNIKIVISIILWGMAAFLIFKGLFAPSRLKAAAISQKAGVRADSSKMAACRGKLYIYPRKGARTSVNIWGKSPFLPLKTEAARVMTESGGIELEGIMWDEKTPCAIINGRVVKAKDRIGDNEVVEIKKDRVILNDGKNLIEINIATLKKE